MQFNSFIDYLSMVVTVSFQNNTFLLKNRNLGETWTKLNQTLIFLGI